MEFPALFLYLFDKEESSVKRNFTEKRDSSAVFSLLSPFFSSSTVRPQYIHMVIHSCPQFVDKLWISLSYCC